MKEELRRILAPYFNHLDEIEVDKKRIEEAKSDCIARKGFYGCWNCENNNERCAVNQTMQMVEAKTRLMHFNVTDRVRRWLDDAE